LKSPAEPIMKSVPSPCINVCKIDPATRLCIGCGRTLDEIARWSAMSRAERSHVMRFLKARLKSLGEARFAPADRD
jgi:predicted Fe-S protein YdhL (DUF1289 family)